MGNCVREQKTETLNHDFDSIQVWSGNLSEISTGCSNKFKIGNKLAVNPN